MSDDRPRDPGTPDGQGDGPAFSLEKNAGGTTDDAGREVTYGYGAPSYGSGAASGNSYDANAAQGPTVEPDPSGYAPPSAYAPPSGYDPNAGLGTPGGPSPYATPGGPSPYGTPGGPSPYGTPGGPTPYGTPPPKKKHTGLIVGLVAGGLVLVLVVVGGIVLLASGGGDDSKPAAVVQTYLQALADGDAAKALDQGEKPPDTSWVTADALKAQQKMAKISAISVSDGYSTRSSARVSATYKFGEKQADESFSLTKIGGAWKLDDTTYPIEISSINDIPGLSLLGVDVGGKGKVYVFPGPLTWASSNEYLTVTESTPDDFSLSPEDGSFSSTSLETGLSDKGEQAVADAVTKYITDCAASKSLEPSGCPQSEYDYSAVDGSATWTAPSDLSSLKYQSDGSSATEVYVTGDLTWSVSYTSQDFNGAQTPVTKTDVDGSIYGTVDLAADPPAFSS